MQNARKFYRRRPRKYVRRPRRSTKKAGTKSTRFVRAVKKIVNGAIETKQAFRTTGDTPIQFNSGMTSAADIQTLVPNIAQGTSDYARLGDQITAMKLVVKGHLIMNIDTSSTQANKRICVRMLVVTPKRFPNQDDAYANWNSWYGQLLKKGGTQTAFVGNISDLYADINTEDITCHFDKKFYLSQDNIHEWMQTTNVGSKLAQNIRQTIKFFNFTIPCRNKKLQYDAGASSNLLPTNFGPVFLLGYAHLDGTSPDVVDTQLGCCFDSTLHYKDA